MSVRSARSALAARALVIAALAASSLGAVATSAQAGTVDDLHCAVTSLTAPVPLVDAVDSGVSSALVRSANDLSAAQWHDVVADDTSWVDTCAQVFVVDEAAPAGQQVVADVAPAETPSDVFGLASRPGADRTIYLDFDGSSATGTRWRKNQEIVSPAYSIDSDPATFDATERAQIYLAWQVVSEDFAPFDVNVTTRQPASSALTRTNAADPTYGMAVVITPTNSVATGCSCGGQAYVGVFGSVSANDAQPTWVFTQGSGTGGYNVGQAISHEVGHTFGLSHDGTSQTSYYAGAKGWAPIMGSSYGQRASHWSRGEYADADNTEDDMAIIAKKAPVLADDHADDHADDLVDATQVTVGSSTEGTITSRTDTDAFTFTASGPVTLTVAGPAGYSDLDAQATVYDALGTEVATIDPVADVASDESMSATWAAELPSPAVSYTVVVDGVGTGDPKEPGRYSDYASVGTYSLGVVAGLPAAPPATAAPQVPTPTSPASSSTAPTTAARSQLSFVTTTIPGARAGRKYRAEIRFSGPVSEARVDWRLPQGLRWRVVGDRILITGKVAKRTRSRFATILSGDDMSVRQQFRLVVR